ncbi:hypothetical protein HD554DRAFT_2127174 [Boletus coccyginus]|nr:hypothetical protein HD554DRAFT_2127174 [Boletus coccyginus]
MSAATIFLLPQLAVLPSENLSSIQRSPSQVYSRKLEAGEGPQGRLERPERNRETLNRTPTLETMVRWSSSKRNTCISWRVDTTI